MGFGQFNLLNGKKGRVDFSDNGIARNIDNPLIEKVASQNPDLAAFLFWSRMPYAEISEQDGVQRVIVRDAGFSDSMVGDRFSVTTDLEN